MTRPVIEIAARARRDLDGHVRWLRAEAGPNVAMRLTVSAKATFHKLADSPGMGSPIEFGGDGIKRLRKWRVDGFPDLLIFYRGDRKLIQIVRVLHTAQDWATIL